MKIRSDARFRRRTAESGYVLAVVIFMLAVLLLSLAVVAPRIRLQLQRDREVETTHRGKQYIRAIQIYYRKFHAYPPSLAALENTGNMRFLRKRYINPITGKDDWQPIQFGQNKVPTVFGFFGQPLPISSIPGTGLVGRSAISNEDPVEAGSSLPGSTNSNPSPSSMSGQTFGGARIIGISIPSEKKSILVYKKQNHFNKWEFVYDPIQDSGSNFGILGAAAAGGNSGTQLSTNGNQPAPGGPDTGPGPPSVSPPPTPVEPEPPPPLQPTCGGTWSPNGSLPSPCPEPEPE